MLLLFDNDLNDKEARVTRISYCYCYSKLIKNDSSKFKEFLLILSFEINLGDKKTRSDDSSEQISSSYYYYSKTNFDNFNLDLDWKLVRNEFLFALNKGYLYERKGEKFRYFVVEN